METLVVGSTELFKIAVKALNGQFELRLSIATLLELKGELVNVESQLSDLLILLLVASLELLNGAEEFFDSGLKSVDFSFILTKSSIGESQLSNELFSLEQLVAEILDGTFLDKNVLLEVGNLALKRLDFGTFTDQMFELSSSKDEANSKVFILNLKCFDLSVTLRQND